MPEQLSRTVETLYRSESRVLVTLMRILGDGDLDLAEEAMHEAFTAALEFCTQTGIPDRPGTLKKTRNYVPSFAFRYLPQSTDASSRHSPSAPIKLTCLLEWCRRLPNWADNSNV
jgi:hypothetical protein